MNTRMTETRNDLSESVRRDMADLLNARLADAIDLFTHAKQAHWNARGPGFIALHELFDQAAGMAAAQADELAERARQLGGEARGLLREAVAATSLGDYPPHVTDAAEHVVALVGSLAGYGASVRQAIRKAEEAGDRDTADLFTGLSRAVDKMLWLVESHQPADAAAATRKPTRARDRDVASPAA
jgi:starvation-inducible DNA-binding protein